MSSVAAVAEGVRTVLDGRRCVCEGSFELPVPPERAFPLFTPLGECDWVPGWEPDFVHPTSGELEVDQVFVTGHGTSGHGGESTLWSVVSADPAGHRAEYLRVTPGSRSGKVSVAVDPSEKGSRVHVKYTLTALVPEAVNTLEDFADGYGPMLDEWHGLTAKYLGVGG